MITYSDFIRNNRGGNGGDYYEYITDPDEWNGYGPSIAHHRIIAWAHGELADIHEGMEIDHVYHGRTLWPLINFAAGLEAVEPSEHWDRTHSRRARRRNEKTRREHRELIRQ